MSQPNAETPPRPWEQDWPADGLEAQDRCPVCGSTGREPLHPELRDRIFFSAIGRWAMQRCLGCRAGYLDPRPTPAAIGLAYTAYYTHAAPADDSYMSSFTFVGGRFKALRNAWLNGRFPRLGLSPALPFGGSLLELFPRTCILAERDVRHLPAPAGGARLVDIGCGSGAFVKRAEVLGYAAEGLEFDGSAVEAARNAGLNVRQGSLPETGLADGAYEAVTLSQVIEHLHDPLAALRDIFRILKAGGLFWLATPNMNSAGHGWFGADWRGLEPPRHLVLFSPEALQLALEKAGFVDVRFRPPGDTAIFFFEASRRIADGLPPGTPVSLGAKEQAEVKRIDALARRDARAGEELVVTARRP